MKTKSSVKKTKKRAVLQRPDKGPKKWGVVQHDINRFSVTELSNSTVAWFESLGYLVHDNYWSALGELLKVQQGLIDPFKDYRHDK